MTDYSRQSFLGPHSYDVLKSATIGFCGLGGGGSHAVQQAAHLGIGNFLLIDPDAIENTNLNRLVGGTDRDVKLGTGKVEIAKRLILSINPLANVVVRRLMWQEAVEALKHCDIVIGGLDSVRGKDELERFCRSLLIPYIDMGMDVHEVTGRFLVSGQVILSSPGEPCLRCFGLVTEEALEAEGARYGAAGGRPQVVWPNGVLASTAIGLMVQALTPWHDKALESACLEYDGNKHTVTTSAKMSVLRDRPCPHYKAGQVGDPFFDIRVPWTPAVPERPLSIWEKLFAFLNRLTGRPSD